MAEADEGSKEGNPASDPKFQRFAASVERALKGFELSREWHDLISCLARLNKVLLAYVHFNVLPHKHLICKRLAQCLHPSLPGGVHLKVLDVYKVIFDRIGHDGLARDLFLYSSGLFPLMEYGSMQVRPIILDLYEQYYIPLGLALLPGLSGLISALLPGLEEGSEHIDKVTHLLNSLCSTTDHVAFACAVWNVLLTSPNMRLHALTYLLPHFTKGTSEVFIALKQVDTCPELFVSALCSSLVDSNVLVERHTLDLVTHLLPLNAPPINPTLLIQVIISSLQCLLKRDQSLNRRLYAWLLGNSQTHKRENSSSISDIEDPSSDLMSYFNTYVRPHLLLALKKILKQASKQVATTEKASCLLPYRLLKFLNDKAEIQLIFNDILSNILHCLKAQVSYLGGLPSSILTSFSSQNSLEVTSKKNSKRYHLKEELLHSANQLLISIDSDILWGWAEGYLVKLIKGLEEQFTPCLDEYDRSDSLEERIELVIFLLHMLPLANMEGALTLYLPNLLLHFTVTLTQTLPSLTLQDIKLSASFITRVLSLLNQYIQVLGTRQTSLTSSEITQNAQHSPCLSMSKTPSVDGVIKSPNKEKLLSFNTSINPLEGSEVSLGGLVMALIQQSQTLIQIFVSTRICDMEDVSADEMVTMATKDALKHISTSDDLQLCECRCVGSESGDGDDDDIANGLNSLCGILMESLTLLSNLSVESLIKSPVPASPWLQALLLTSLRTTNIHLLLTSLRTVFILWQESAKKGDVVLSDIVCSVANIMGSRTELIQVFTLFLWSLLSPAAPPPHHEEAAHFLSLLFSLTPPSIQVEGFLLEMFAANSVEPYERFALFWQYTIITKNLNVSRLKRLILRMIEGLQSHYPAISHCTTTWLVTTCQRNHLHSALNPLYTLIQEACPPKVKVHQEKVDRESDSPVDDTYAKYYRESLKKNDKESDTPLKKLAYPFFYLTRLLDAPRFNYGLSLFISLFSVHSELILSSLANARDSTSSPGPSNDSNITGTITETVHAKPEESTRSSTEVSSDLSRPKHLPVASKSLLEVILTYCTEIILSEYPDWLDTTLTDQQNLLSMKTISTELVVKILTSFIRVLDDSKSSSLFFSESIHSVNIHNPSYLKGLLSLCEIQKATLTSLSHLAGLPTEHSQKTPVPDDQQEQILPGVSTEHAHKQDSVQPLFLHLLRSLYCQLVLECLSLKKTDSPIMTIKNKDDQSHSEYSYIPGHPLTSQSMFLLLLQRTLVHSKHVNSHLPLLLMIQLSLPYLRENLDLIAPKLLKYICKNLNILLKEKADNRCSICCHGEMQSMTSTENFKDVTLESTCTSTMLSWKQCTCATHSNLIVSYVQTLSVIVHYCLLSNWADFHLSHKTPISSSPIPIPHYQLSDSFWDLASFKSMDPNVKNSHTTVTTTTERKTFGLSWIFGSIFSGGSHGNDQVINVRSGDIYRGVNTPAGQKILRLLQTVYGTLTKLWKELCDSGKEKHHLKEDIDILIRQFLNPLLEDNDILFFSSIAQTWMQWNLAGKTKKLIRDSFIELMHTFKLCSLEELLISMSSTLVNMRGDEDIALSRERQKYLLHFLYRYIYSPLQSFEELESCSALINTFLKDSFNLVTVGVDPNNHGNIPLVCMLTSLLHVFVCRVPAPDLKTNKKQRRELQDIIYRLCDVLSQATIVPPQSTSPQPTAQSEINEHNTSSDVSKTTENTKTFLVVSENVNSQESDSRKDGIVDERNNVISSPTNELKMTSDLEAGLGIEVQAMAVLSNVLSHFVDCVYGSNEKDRVISLLKIVLRNVWPSLRNYNPHVPGCYVHAARLLASLSGFQVTRKCWKDEVMELFMDSKFFIMEESCIHDWKIIIDNLMSQDKLMFRSLLNRIPTSSSATGMGNIFSSLELERVQRAKLFKRLAFVILCGEKDQYSGQLHDITEKLLDSVRWYSGPSLNAEVLFTLRVLLIKLSAENLSSMWPALLTELTTAFTELHSDLMLELATPLTTSRDKINWYYSACKVLETALSLSSNLLPQFQIISWGFIGERGTDKKGLIGTILDAYKEERREKDVPTSDDMLPPPHFSEVKSAIHFVPILCTLSERGSSPVINTINIERIEELMLVDYVEQ